MEMRSVREVKIFILKLNDMRSAKIEYSEVAAISTDLDKLKAWYEEQRAPEAYRDGQWNKYFKKGSPLEWYNPGDGFCGQGIFSEWVREYEYQSIRGRGNIIIID
jgi:hypothetical protein